MPSLRCGLKCFGETLVTILSGNLVQSQEKGRHVILPLSGKHVCAVERETNDTIAAT